MSDILAYLTAIALILGSIYLMWVLVSWALIFVAVSFGAVVTISPWVLAIPLLVASSIFTKSGK